MDAKVNTIESERIIAILEDTTEKLFFLDSISPDILQHRDELSKFIGDEISRTMAEQNSLENQYEKLIEQRSAMKGMVNKNKYKEIQDEIESVSRSLRESTNNLVRSLKENPNVSGNMIKVQRDRTELHDLLLRCVQELRDRGTYYTISHRVDEENNSRLRLLELKSREKTLQDIVKKLENQVNEEELSFKKITSEQTQAIAHLKDEIQNLKGSTSTDAKFQRKESLANVSSIWRSYKLRERGLENKLKELEEKLKTETIVNNETKNFLVKKQKHLIEETNKWDAKYESEIAEMDNELKKVTQMRGRLLDKLSYLKARKLNEDAEEKARIEAETHKMEMNKQKTALLKKQNKAARKLQKEFRLFLLRKNEGKTIKKLIQKEKKEKKEKKPKK